MEFSAQQIASVLGGTVEGDPEVKVNNFSKIEEGKPGTLTFLANPKYEHFIYQTEASIVLVNNDFTPAEPIKATLVKVANAYASLAILLNMAEQANVKKAGIDATAFIAGSATVGEGCYVGNFAYIGEDVKIGKNSRCYPHARKERSGYDRNRHAFLTTVFRLDLIALLCRASFFACTTRSFCDLILGIVPPP